MVQSRLNFTMSVIYTIGHSNHTSEAFTKLLTDNKIEAVVDVRSSPYSRIHHQFNRESLKLELAESDIQYVYLGDELGARPKDQACYVPHQVEVT